MLTRESVTTYANSFNNSYTLADVTAAAGDLIVVAVAGRTSSLFTFPTPTWNGETFTVVSSIIDEPIGLQVFKLQAASSATASITGSAGDYGGIVAHAIVYSGDSPDADGIQTGEWYTGAYALPSETVSGYVAGNIVADFLVATLRNDGAIDVPDTLYITNGTGVSTINSEAGRVGRMYYSEHASGSVSYTKSDSENPTWRIAAFRLYEGGGGGSTVDSYPGGVVSGETGVAYTTTGVASVTSISLGSLAATSISDTAGDGTHSVPALADEVAHELYGPKTVTFNGTGPTTTTTLNPPTGNDFVTLSGTLNTTETGGLYNFSPAAVITDQIVFPDTGIAYDAQGNITGEAGSYSCWHIQASTKIARSYTVTLGEDGGGGGGGSNGVLVSVLSNILHDVVQDK